MRSSQKRLSAYVQCVGKLVLMLLSDFKIQLSINYAYSVIRTSNYQKKITRVGSMCYEIECAVKLQALWRAFRARSQYYLILREFYRNVSAYYGYDLRTIFEKTFSCLHLK